MQDKNNNNVSLPVVNQSPAPSNGQVNPGTNSKVGEKTDKGSLPSLGGFKFETKATDVYKRGIVGKGRDFFQLKENSHVQFSKNEDILHNYFYKYLNEKKTHWMPHLAGEIIVNAQGSVVQVSGTEVLAKKKETDGFSKEPVIKGAKRLSSNLKKPGTPLKKLSGEIEFKQVNILGKSIDQEFHEATSIQKSGRTTLYSTIINTNDNLIKIAESSIQHNDSPTTSIIQQSKFDAKTYIDQTQRSYNSNIKGIYQMNAPLNSSYLIDKYSKKYDMNIAKDFASGLYIPLTQRQLKFDNRTKKQRRLNPLTESNQNQVKKNEDENQLQSRKNNQSPFITAKEILEKIKHISPNKQQIKKDQNLDIILSHSQTIFQDDQSNLDQMDDIQKGAQTERNQTLQNALHLQLGFLEQDNQNQMEAQQRLKPKRQSFSLCQTKFNDAREAVDMHPLLHAKMKGPILIDLETIYKMKKAKRYPIPEKILHSNDTFQLQIDSIIRQAYDNDEIEFSANQKQEIDAPCNSMESNEKIEFYSSGSDDDIIHDQEITDSNKKQNAKNESDVIQIVKKRKKSKYQTELPPDTKEARAYEDKMQSIKIHKDAIDLQGFDIELLKDYPKNHTEGDIPSFLIKNDKRLAGYYEIQKTIKEEFDSKILLPTNDHIQLIFEMFCKEFDCQPFSVLKYFHLNTMSFKNYFLSLQQAKAICCTIPLIPRLKKIQFCNNNLSDEMSSLIILSAFMNPVLTEISIQKNNIKKSSINTLIQMLYYQTNKILELDISVSIDISNNLEKLIYNFGNLKGMRDVNGDRLGSKLKSLDLSNIQLSSSACMHVGNTLVNTQNLRQINLQGCQISGLGTRYIIDSLNQNIGLQFFNFSHNSMASNVYENAVKIAKIIARHQEMMHYDLTNTSLLREEVIFIGMALPISRSCIGIHMSGNGLEYYDRVFLRTLIDAKVAFHFKNFANLKNNNSQQLRQSENNHYNQLEIEEQKDDELSSFIKTFNYIEKQKLVLNEELAFILQESDFLQLFRTIRKGRQKNSNSEALGKSQSAQQKLVDLINKINDRQRLIDNQQKEMLKYSEQNLNLNDPLVIKNLTTMGLYKKIKINDETDRFESDGQEEKIININKNQDLNEDLWLMQNSLKIERIRQRVQLDALKHIKSKSSAEIALMFTSINKIAYDILMQNPMSAYMTEVVFTRILGNEDVEQSETWKDCTQCWICEKWNKNKIEFKIEYLGNMRQKISQIHELHDVLEKCLDSQNHHMLKQIGIKNLSIQNNNKKIKKKIVLQDQQSEKTLSKDRLETQSIDTESDIEINLQNLDGDIINPIKLDRAKIEKMLPENHRIVKSIHRISPQNQQEISESSDDDLLSDSNYRHKFDHQNIQGYPLTPLQQTKSSFNQPKQYSINHPKFQQAQKLQQNTFQQPLNVKDFKDQDLKALRNSQQYQQKSKKLDQEESYASKIKQQQAELEIKNQNHKKKQLQVQKRGESSKYKKQDGKFYRLKQKKVYFQGVYHLVDYEVKVDSDENSSGIDTSDDEFKVDSELVVNQFNQAVSKKIISMTANSQQIQQILIQNQPKQTNVFGRKQIFLCASFNDWVPVEMKKIKEIKLEKQHGDNLAQFLKQNKDKIDSQKEINNIIQYSSFLPPGRHFFYFIFNNSQIILSSNHQIVRFGDSSVFLNQIEVEQRNELPKKFSLKQNRSNQEGNVFKKERSVFKTYQEDDPDFVRRMIKCDLKYSKIERLCQRSEKADKVVEILEKHYVKLKSIYNYYIANSSNYPRMSLKDFTQICYRCKLFDRNLNLVSMERNLVTTNTSINPYKNSDDKELNRYEFLEVLVRTAKSKYQDPKIFQSLNDALGKLIFFKMILYLEILLSKDFMPHCKFLDGVKFRAQHVFQQQVDEIFRKNDQVIRQLFQFCQKLQPIVQAEEFDQIDQKKAQGLKVNDKQKQFQVSKTVEKNISQLTKISTTPDMATPNLSNNQIQLSIVNIRELCQRANLNIKVMKINQNFVESLMSRIDTMKDPTLATNMRFAEFLIFIAKTAFDIYQGTKEEEEIQLAQKIDIILEPLLSVAGLQKKFSFLNKDQQSSSEEKDNDSEND